MFVYARVYLNIDVCMLLNGYLYLVYRNKKQGVSIKISKSKTGRQLMLFNK